MPEPRKVLLSERDDLFVVHDFLLPAECVGYIELCELAGFGDAPIVGIGGPVMRKDIRNNDRVILDEPRIASEMWKRLRPFFPEVAGAWAPVL